LPLSRKVDDKENIASAYLFLKEGWEKLGDYKKALAYEVETG